jgi:hypothetical protein
VVAVASGISIGKGKVSIHVLEGISVPNSLIHESDETRLVSRGAITFHNERRISDVRLVVVRIQVLAIPALGEHKFQTNTIGTVFIEIGFVWHVMAIKCSFGRSGVIQAVKSKGFLFKSLLGNLGAGPVGLRGIRNRPSEVTLERVSCEHAESCRERVDLLAGSLVVEVIAAYCAKLV